MRTWHPSQWLILLFVVAIVFCVVGAFRVGGEPKDADIVTRLRNRARYLRWLSMGCLAVMGAMVAAGVETVHLGDKGPEKIASVAMAGIVAVVLASVYRYIVRLAYFFEARADAFQLLVQSVDAKSRTVEVLAHLTDLLAPDHMSYEGTGTALKGLAAALIPSSGEKEGAHQRPPSSEAAAGTVLDVTIQRSQESRGVRS